jgi:hypothetical protein
MHPELRAALAESVVTVPVAGAIVGNLGRAASYRAAKRGDIPVVRIGRKLMVSTEWLRRQLQIGDAR